MSNELTKLYHTREEMVVLHDLVQRAIDADDPIGFLMLNSLRTMFAEAITGQGPTPTRAKLVKLTVADLDQLVAVMSGAVDRIEHAGGVALVRQLRDLRERLLEADLQLREEIGLPTT